MKYISAFNFDTICEYFKAYIYLQKHHMDREEIIAPIIFIIIALRTGLIVNMR